MKLFGLFQIAETFKMSLKKTLNIPCVPNFANLIVYPAEKKVVLLKCFGIILSN